ncbi:uncharacterized protein CBL_09665 [Carabus blaptoides fortunei]
MDCHDKKVTCQSETEEPISFGELYAKAPNMMVCFKRARDKTSGSVSTKNAKNRVNEKRAKSRELRAGILYVGCDCEKRNGLQDQCPRSECQGRPPCLTKPPTCPPSEFANAKHLTRKTDLFLQRKRDAEKAKLAEAAKEALAATQAQERQERGTEHRERLHYDCIPIDQLVNEGDLCPVCTKPLDFVEPVAPVDLDNHVSDHVLYRSRSCHNAQILDLLIHAVRKYHVNHLR